LLGHAFENYRLASRRSSDSEADHNLPQPPNRALRAALTQEGEEEERKGKRKRKWSVT
jgi:hypothetical protein